ncbi:hypothetical protein GCM10010156_58840 [Planobispora rosea]|uniref:Regulatory protein n=1 Tax=Planobispora rosea TaxID=35762 RepID=A0A8J3S4V5_PLARO|nr:DUF5685 family protein [Planobispora rosea]GGS92842.1 hypothetical protein GCM10010156_58840 [Planobispora rosea]GIH87218.1 hypothetical protein Pro02_56260 [Planobispora rosea]
MFGIIRPCGEHGCPSLHRAWRAHLCGLCLTLRDGQGHGGRLATNYDTLIISVLAEAQLPSASPHRTAGPCALRGFRSADVVDARAQGAQLAAAVSLVLAAGRIRDQVVDGDVAAGTGPARMRLAARWEASGARLGAGVGFDTAVLASTVDRQLDLERRAASPSGPGGSGGSGGSGARPITLLDLTRPAEDAVAAAFAHTAVLAGRPGNADALAEAGRFFGRIAHLLDAVEDQEDDDARGRFNPLTATGATRREARRLCDDAVHGLTLALRDMELQERHLVEVLLGTEVRRAVERAFRDHPADASYERPGWIRKSAAGVATFFTCGMWRPRWSRRRGLPRSERCYLRDADCCSCCDCDCCGCCA